jgi:hypothetical protein
MYARQECGWDRSDRTLNVSPIRFSFKKERDKKGLTNTQKKTYNIKFKQNISFSVRGVQSRNGTNNLLSPGVPEGIWAVFMKRNRRSDI